MAEISAEQVQELRKATNVGFMECKRALAEAGGDFQKAVKILRERGMAVAAAKSGRTARNGVIASASSEGGRIVSLVEVNCETDFVARNAVFLSFVAALAEKACQVDSELAGLVQAEVAAKIAEIGENIVVRRNTRYALAGPGRIISYIHPGGRIGVLLELGCENESAATGDAFGLLAKDLALHVAASAPRHISPADVPSEELAAEREIYARQVQGKPPQVVEKIVDGKLKKYFSEICLLEQGFVKEPKLAVKALIDQKSKELGETLSVRRFTRYQIGEAAG